MPDHGLGDALRLRGRRAELLLQQLERDVPAVELEGHARRGHVCVCGADVVEEAGEEVGFGGDGEGVRGGQVGLHRDACGGMSPVSGWCGWLFLVLRAIEGFGGDSWYRTVVVDAHAVVEGLFS